MGSVIHPHVMSYRSRLSKINRGATQSSANVNYSEPSVSHLTRPAVRESTTGRQAATLKRDIKPQRRDRAGIVAGIGQLG